MNIRSVSNPLVLEQIDKVRGAHQEVKSDETQDRDADGKQQQSNNSNQRKLSDSEIQDCIEVIKSIKGVRDNNLNVQLQDENGVKKIVIMDSAGNVVKRIPESEFYQVLDKKGQDSKTGSLLSKAA